MRSSLDEILEWFQMVLITIFKYSYSSHKKSFEVCPVEIAFTKQMIILRNDIVMTVHFYYFSLVTHHVM